MSVGSTGFCDPNAAPERASWTIRVRVRVRVRFRVRVRVRVRVGARVRGEGFLDDARHALVGPEGDGYALVGLVPG